MPAKKKNRNRHGGPRQLLKNIGPFNLLIASLLSAFLGQFLIYNNGTLVWGVQGSVNFWPGLVLLIAGAVFMILAAAASGTADAVKEKMDGRVEMLALLVIVAIAVFYRTYMINVLPSGCYRDEGQNGNEAINIMNGTVVDGTALPVYIERWTQNAAMYMYFVAASFKFFGVDVMQIRLVSIVFGILCIPAFYFLVRNFFGPRIAIIAAFSMAVMRWHVTFSRMGFLGIVTVFFIILCIYFAWRSYVRRKTSDFILLGFTVALSLYSYIAARLIPLGIGIFMAYLLFKDMKFYQKNWKKMAVAFGVFIVTSGPLIAFAAQHPDTFMSRSSTVSIFNKEMLHEVGGRYVENDGTPKAWYKLYLDNVQNTLLMFNYVGDGNPRHNFHTMPEMDFVLGIFFFLGLIFAVWRWKEPMYFLLLSLFAAFLQAGLLSTESPQAYRTIGEIPVVIIFAMIAARETWRIIREKFGKASGAHAAVIAAAAMLFMGWQNYDQYFNEYYNNPGSWAEFSVEEYHMGKYLNKLGDDWVGIVDGDWLNSYSFKFATYPYKNYVEFSPSDWIPIKTPVKKNFVYILDESYLPLLPVLKSMYPEGVYSDYRHKFFPEKILYFAYEVPYSDVLKQQSVIKKNGLTGYYYSDNIRKTDRVEAVKLSNHWQGNAVKTELDPFILFNWTLDPLMGPFSVKWTGRIKIDEPGTYEFTTKSNDYSDLAIDGKTVLKNTGGGGGLNPVSVKLTLGKGFHTVIMRYYESVQYSKMQFWWKKPGTSDPEVVPSEVLYP